MSASTTVVCCAIVAGLLTIGGHAQIQVQHTRPLVAPAQAPNAFGPGMAMAPASIARQGLLSANTENNDAPNNSDCSSSNSSSLLFIQQSMTADLLTANNRTILTMRSVPTTIFFTDKPERHAGAMSTGYFTTDKAFFSNTSNQWLDSPNAALYGMNGVGDRPIGDTVVIVTLGRPVFDNSTNDLQYEVTFVPNMRHQSKTANFYKRHANATGSPKVITAVERVMRLKNAALFIDNFDTTGLLAPNPVDNTYIPGAGGYGYPGAGFGWW
ncbi:g635 [Coccomyxa viridis]|uniref:G635 protein n=1 Tax=Coccomyxa viridis TaxID=1274662 RepID=A0ABP1FGD0_9CHLO